MADKKKQSRLRRVPRVGAGRPKGAGPRVGVWQAIREHPIAFALPILLLVGLALGVSLARTPTWTAETRLGVSRINVTAPGALAGYTQASQSLAQAYSRLINAEEVVNEVSRLTDVDADAVRGRLSATPIPESPVFRVEATGGSRRRTIELANTGAEVLIEYATEVARSNPDAKRLLRKYRQASLTLNRAQLAYQDVRRSLRSEDTPQVRVAFARAKAARDAARLRASSLEEAYAEAQSGLSNTELIQLLSRAKSADSDRDDKLQIYLYVAVLAGGLGGVALAMARSRRRPRAQAAT